MKKTISSLALAIVFLASGAQAGLQKGQVQISPVFGISFPIGDFEDGNEVGTVFGIRGAYFLTSNISAGLTALRNNLDFNTGFDIREDMLLAGAESDFSITEVSANFRYHFYTESFLSPYLSGSAGVFMNRISRTAPGMPDESTTQSKLGFGGSAGFIVRGQGSDAGFLEARILTDSFDFGDPVSGSSEYLSIHAGITFFFGGDE